ncbi:hypothetical protein P7K49_018933 [Saguinus oedipus]|uniref:Uncharacterized protein n=1 Tax=Saguinus oedipus TaxID=9490 RepID=A0ABQ9UVZ6_SAGOE|nr:hypothetical protein P7K49_018933 [Saguinus oedipus]
MTAVVRARGAARWTTGRGRAVAPTAVSEDVELPSEDHSLLLWPESSKPEEQKCHNHSPSGDSRSIYVNNTPEEEDHDEGLPGEEEGITYYICCGPKDNSYLEGMDCNGDEYLVRGTHPVDADKCQENLHRTPHNCTSEELNPPSELQGTQSLSLPRFSICRGWIRTSLALRPLCYLPWDRRVLLWGRRGMAGLGGPAPPRPLC